MKYSWFLLIIIILFCQIETVVPSLVSLAQKATVEKLSKNVNRIDCEISRLPEELKTVVLHELAEPYAKDIYENQLKGIKPSNADKFKESIQEKLSVLPIDFKRTVENYFVLRYANCLASWQWDYIELPGDYNKSIYFNEGESHHYRYGFIMIKNSGKDWRIYPFEELLEQVVQCIKSSPLRIKLEQSAK